MLDIIRAIILGLLQGLTEFIPVSSSAHLIIAENAFNVGFSSLAFDVVLHLGTLLALLVYFWSDIVEFTRRLISPASNKRLVYCLIIATIPAAVTGFFLVDIVETYLRSLWVIVVMLLLVAGVMFVADRDRGNKQLEDMTYGDALLIGLAQALALVPGTSRSGSTIVAGSLLKYNNAVAAQFSFYLAIPIVFGANIRLIGSGDVLQAITQDWLLYLLGAAVAAISGYAVVKLLLAYLQRHSLQLFAWYRIALALLLSVMLIL